MIRRPPRSTQSRSSAASDVYKRQVFEVTARRRVVVSALAELDARIPPAASRRDVLHGRQLRGIWFLLRHAWSCPLPWFQNPIYRPSGPVGGFSNSLPSRSIG